MKPLSKKTTLAILGLPVIEDLNDFSNLTRFSKKLIYNCSKNNTKYYKEYRKRKKSGGYRIICQPSSKMKALQVWILRNILDKLSSSDASKGFDRGSKITHNAGPHIGANVVLAFDVKDFFPSIDASKIYCVFYSLGYNKFISSILTSICTYKGYLPQGGPCSPKLANLVCIRLDNRIQGYVGKRGIIYTRYADDLTFSGDSASQINKSSKVIKNIIHSEGLEINNNKTRISGPRRQKKITGLVVNESSVGIGNQKFRILRAKIFNLLKIKSEEIEQRDINHIKGYLSFLKDVDLKRHTKIIEYLNGFRGKFVDDAVIEKII